MPRPLNMPVMTTEDNSKGYSISNWRQHVATDPLEGHNIPSLAASAETTSINHSFCTGTGGSLLKDYILPDAMCAQWEVIFVTCFWAKESQSRKQFCAALEFLSAHITRKRKESPNKKIADIKIYLCISSVSLLQKLQHTESPRGYTYHKSEWKEKLGLPHASQIPGLDLKVKSVFIRPFSVMHPKFVIVDRKLVWVPSCNVSWESWFEGAFRLQGDIVKNFYKFWAEVWAHDGVSADPNDIPQHVKANSLAKAEGSEEHPLIQPAQGSPGRLVCPSKKSGLKIQTLFLPSSHHQDPRFRPGPFRVARSAPRTPLNAFTTFLFANATSEIYIITPNITTKQVLKELVDALRRGVDVTIVTNTDLMLLEQLVTSGTTTHASMRYLASEHKKLLKDSRWIQKKPGDLVIRYWKAPKPGRDMRGESAFHKSHLKLTIVDGEVIIFGSGNMDRASWYTSQELGVAVYSTEMAEKIMHDGLAVDVGSCSIRWYGSFQDKKGEMKSGKPKAQRVMTTQW
ncbi:hypothetical protein AJ79_02253 [Helicocarpus griseus UAMH5409]|uniref:PLD phosphodiesterase domain-containing protein n=1 Tax=Helicocarpus griseus UAMH5409 TaxID=1447875 RepID=A0A2B7Y3D8_9EURO|nr:hypothetical protein AJ79_02253 [Helicocarpus griseus UAMH5409]